MAEGTLDWRLATWAIRLNSFRADCLELHSGAALAGDQPRPTDAYRSARSRASPPFWIVTRTVLLTLNYVGTMAG